MWWIVRVIISAAIIATVSAIAQRLPRFGALLLSLPLVTILAFVMTWHDHHDLPAIARLSKETLVFVLLGLPLFIPLAFAPRLGFWVALAAGTILASATIALWFRFGPNSV